MSNFNLFFCLFIFTGYLFNYVRSQNPCMNNQLACHETESKLIYRCDIIGNYCWDATYFKNASYVILGPSVQGGPLDKKNIQCPNTTQVDICPAGNKFRVNNILNHI